MLAALATVFVGNELSSLAEGTSRGLVGTQSIALPSLLTFSSIPTTSEVKRISSVLTTEFSTQLGYGSAEKPNPQDNDNLPIREPTTSQEANEKAVRMSKYNSTYQYKPPQKEYQRAPECGAEPQFLDFFKQGQKVRSRFLEDQIIYEHFFQGKLPEHGKYIELGAFDGQQEANSRFYDLCLGWKGLLIEGNPLTFDKMQRARPQAHRMSFAPSCSAEYEAVNKTVQFAKYPMANAGIRGKAKTYDAKPMVAVPCGPLTPVLQDIFEGQPINFFSLDVEGAEPMVLSTIDFTKVQIVVMMIEVENTYCRANCESRDQTRAIMKAAGYKRYEHLVQASDVYIRPGSAYELPEVPLLG